MGTGESISSMSLLRFLDAVRKHWWPLMSCAVFTLLGMWVLYANKSNAWALQATFGLAVFCLFWACFLAWRDKEKEVEELKTKLEGLEASRNASPVVNVQISGLNQTATDGPPRLGMRVISLFDSSRTYIGGPTIMEVEFRLCLLSGRPATSVTIQPVYSGKGYFSIHFGTLSFVRGSEEQIIGFEIKRNERSLPRNRAGLPEWGMGDFLWDSGIDSGIETSPIILNFRDGAACLEQRFRMTFDFNTRTLSIIDEYPKFVLQNTLDNIPLL
jgi:hypothetical protein